jgi:hypothetical protein
MSLSYPLGILGTVEAQLVLIETDQSDWRLDEHTREIGLRGIETARAALREARRAAADRNHASAA